jgi:hypothetical protein
MKNIGLNQPYRQTIPFIYPLYFAKSFYRSQTYANDLSFASQLVAVVALSVEQVKIVS